MQKRMQKVVARNIRGDLLGISTISIPSYKPGRSEDTAIHNVITHIQEENREVTLEHSQTLRELMIALHAS